MHILYLLLSSPHALANSTKIHRLVALIKSISMCDLPRHPKSITINSVHMYENEGKENFVFGWEIFLKASPLSILGFPILLRYSHRFSLPFHLASPALTNLDHGKLFSLTTMMKCHHYISIQLACPPLVNMYYM
jgi:hypothetical protein